MKFDDFHLHNDLITNLKQSIKAGRIPHAQYFQGQDGSGNLALAVAYTQEVMSMGQEDMFGQKDDRVSKLAHPDLHIVFPVVQGKVKTSAPLLNDFREKYHENPFMLFSSWMDHMGAANKTPIISVAESEDIYKKLSLKSYEGGYKALIIWQAEMMNAGSSNKMLKLIEEPPAKTLIILVGNDIKALLPTIQSRVQLVEVKSSSDEELLRFLTGKEIPQNQTKSLIGQSGGSAGMALYLGSAEVDNVLLESFMELMRIAFQKNVPGAIKWVDEVAGRGKTFQMNLINFGVDIYRQANLMNFIPEGEKQNDEKSNFIKKFSPFIKMENIGELMEKHQTVHYNLSRNGNAKLLLLDHAFSLMRLIK